MNWEEAYLDQLEKNEKIQAEVERLREALREGVRLLKEGKRLFAPNTTNSDVDYFIQKHSKALEGGGK